MARGTWEEEGKRVYDGQKLPDPIRIPPPMPHGNPKATNEDWRKWYEWKAEREWEEEQARRKWERARERELIEDARREWERARREAERAKLAKPTENGLKSWSTIFSSAYGVKGEKARALPKKRWPCSPRLI